MKEKNSTDRSVFGLSRRVGMGKPCMQGTLMAALLFASLFCLAVPVTADEYSGDYLVTANGTYGHVCGGLYYDNYYASFEYGYPNNISKTFTLPATSVNNITWARLEVVTYIGNSLTNYPIRVRAFIDGANTGTYTALTNSTSDSAYAWGTNSVNWETDNPNASRVSSDSVSWYDVKQYISSQTVNVKVTNAQPDGTQPFDGRVKAIVLIVAYNDCSTGKEYYFWVNQGHDVSCYLGGDEHIGSTTFNTSVIPEIGPANLTVLYISSYNGNYTFNGQSSDLYDSNQLPWSNPKQGPYFGSTSWNVTNKLTQGSDSTLLYTRNGTQTGAFSGYFKIPLAILTVENKKFLYDANNATYHCCGNDCCGKVGLNAYKPEVTGQPPTSASVPSTEFSSIGYSNMAANDNVYEQSSTTSSGKYAAHRFNFTICQSCGDVTNLTATWVGKGYNTGGNGATLYIWNFATRAYEQLDNTSSGDKVTLSGSKISNLCNYIDSSNRVILLAEQNTISTRSVTSHLDTDYVKLEVYR